MMTTNRFSCGQPDHGAQDACCHRCFNRLTLGEHSRAMREWRREPVCFTCDPPQDEDYGP